MNVNRAKKESDFIQVNVLIEHNDKDGFYIKGRKYDEDSIYINKNFVTEVSIPKKKEIYKYTYDNHYESTSLSYFRIIVNNKKYYLKEEEFEKFKDILNYE